MTPRAPVTNPASGAAKARERPILFSSEMVRAILDGRKSMTRRVVRPQPDSVAAFQDGLPTEAYYGGWPKGGYAKKLTCPFGQPGDRLWVRETFLENMGETTVQRWEKTYPYLKALEEWAHWRELKLRVGHPWIGGDGRPRSGVRKLPSILMPRHASRITLEITAVRVERLKDITVTDAQAEGVTPLGVKGDGRRWRAAFRELWDSINAKRKALGWDANPWVWVISFRRLP
jgi:hypothetical protein